MTMNRPSLIGPTAATLGLAVPLVILDRRLQTAGGTGIIPFELAGPDRSSEILRAWGADGQRAARASLLLDFPYLVSYTTLNVRLTDRASAVLTSEGDGVLRAMAPVVKGLHVTAGVCDAIENTALLGVVARGGDAGLASIARTAARVKFAALLIGWAHGGAALLRRRPQKSRSGDSSVWRQTRESLPARLLRLATSARQHTRVVLPGLHQARVAWRRSLRISLAARSPARTAPSM
jgi:hypothetical protein